MIAGLVLAAGAAQRFGAPKQLAELDGRPLLEHVLAAMTSAPLDRVVVVLGAYADEIRARVDLHGAESVVCVDWAEGQSASLRSGVATIEAEADAIVVALGDQPLLAARAVARVVAARGRGCDAVRATYESHPGHPIVLERALFPRVTALTGDAGAREVLASSNVCDVDCGGLGRPDDVDTPEDLAVARA
ncbi:MAG: nucleotidyltransferase family protein [Thermoleophilaceae bacterium]|nr:nucleotidyltransferase family protein [Thermoleophilaceae bacterium]